MNRTLASTFALAALLLVGCGAQPTALQAPVRQTAPVGARYLVFDIHAVKATPAPKGAAFKFRTATIVGGGMFPKTEPITLSASFAEVGGQVAVTLKRDGKPFTDDDAGFYLTQFDNFLVMGRPTAQERAVLEEVLKWTRGGQR